MARDIARDQRRAHAPRLEAGDLLVGIAHPRPLLIVEHRQVEGARHVVLIELGRAAHVDDVVEPLDQGGVEAVDRIAHRLWVSSPPG